MSWDEILTEVSLKEMSLKCVVHHHILYWGYCLRRGKSRILRRVKMSLPYMQESPSPSPIRVPEHIMLILSHLPTETQKQLLDIVNTETGWGSFHWNRAPKELSSAEWGEYCEWARGVSEMVDLKLEALEVEIKILKLMAEYSARE